MHVQKKGGISYGIEMFFCHPWELTVLESSMREGVREAQGCPSAAAACACLCDMTTRGHALALPDDCLLRLGTIYRLLQ